MAGLPKSGPPTLDIGTGIDFTLTVSQCLSAFKIVRFISSGGTVPRENTGRTRGGRSCIAVVG